MISMIVISDEFVQEHVSMPTAIQLVEDAFAAVAGGGGESFPVVVEFINQYDAMFGVKSGYLLLGSRSQQPHSMEVLGLKAGGYWMQNQARFGLPGHQSIMLLFDLENGAPVALIAANAITSLRTGAAGGVAAKYLARPNSRIAAVIGAGDQANMQLKALREVCPIEEVRVWARRTEAADAYAADWGGRGLRATAAGEIGEAVRGADVIITTTPSFEPLIQDEHVRAGVHINAVGSDAKGKQELEAAVLERAKVIVDHFQQSTTIGELQHMASAASLPPSAAYAQLGEICAGLKPGRESEDEITIFDSTGVTFQDLVLAGYLYNLAREQGLGGRVSL